LKKGDNGVQVEGEAGVKKSEKKRRRHHGTRRGGKQSGKFGRLGYEDRPLQKMVGD